MINWNIIAQLTSLALIALSGPAIIFLLYFKRAQAKSQLVPVSQRMEWLTQRDEAERTAWVAMHRETNLTLGQVISTLHHQRQALWEVSFSVPAPVQGGKCARQHPCG